MLVHPNQKVRLAAEIRDDRFARGTLRKMFQKCRGDVHVFEATTRLRLRVPQLFLLAHIQVT
jgi:hypothetical protein